MRDCEVESKLRRRCCDATGFASASHWHPVVVKKGFRLGCSSWNGLRSAMAAADPSLVCCSNKLAVARRWRWLHLGGRGKQSPKAQAPCRSTAWYPTAGHPAGCLAGYVGLPAGASAAESWLVGDEHFVPFRRQKVFEEIHPSPDHTAILFLHVKTAPTMRLGLR